MQVKFIAEVSLFSGELTPMSLSLAIAPSILGKKGFQSAGWIMSLLNLCQWQSKTVLELFEEEGTVLTSEYPCRFCVYRS